MKLFVAATLRDVYALFVMVCLRHFFLLPLFATMVVSIGCAHAPSSITSVRYRSQHNGSRNAQFLLVADVDRGNPQPSPPKSEHANDRSTPQDEKTESRNIRRQPRAVLYTTPGEPYRQLLLAVVASSVGLVEPQNSARNSSESTVATVSGRIGRLGLTAPPTRLAGRVTSRPGLQDGPATGLGFAPAGRNVFTPQFNPLSGPTGRCQELARTGFFNGSAANCRRSIAARRR